MKKLLAISLRRRFIKQKMDKVSFDQFAALELKVGKILSAEKISGSDKLLKLEVSFGDESRQVVSGIALYYKPEELQDKQFVFVTNLEPRKIMGLDSQAMILAADVDGEAVCLIPSREVPVGTKIR